MESRFAVCINNKDYAASLELFKIYQLVPDDRAAEHQLVRVIDESGESYLYPADRFASIELPQSVEKAFSLAR
jgi:hypothetical protein